MDKTYNWGKGYKIKNGKLALLFKKQEIKLNIKYIYSYIDTCIYNTNSYYVPSLITVNSDASTL